MMKWTTEILLPYLRTWPGTLKLILLIHIWVVSSFIFPMPNTAVMNNWNRNSQAATTSSDPLVSLSIYYSLCPLTRMYFSRFLAKAKPCTCTLDPIPYHLLKFWFHWQLPLFTLGYHPTSQLYLIIVLACGYFSHLKRGGESHSVE